MHTISIFVDQNRMPELASYFECQTHLAKNLRNSANFILRNLRTGLKKDPDNRTANENEVIETVRIGIEMANEKLQKDVDRLTKQLQSLPASDPARTKIQKRIENKQKNHPVMPTSDHWMLTYETLDAVMKNTKNPDYYAMPEWKDGVLIEYVYGSGLQTQRNCKRTSVKGDRRSQSLWMRNSADYGIRHGSLTIYGFWIR